MLESDEQDNSYESEEDQHKDDKEWADWIIVLLFFFVFGFIFW